MYYANTVFLFPRALAPRTYTYSKPLSLDWIGCGVSMWNSKMAARTFSTIMGRGAMGIYPLVARHR